MRLDWGHTAKTPYARSTVAAVAALPLTREDRTTIWNTGAKVFGAAVFRRLPGALQQTLRRLAARGVRSA